jgi:choice-of-anchor C domain-containing protein
MFNCTAASFEEITVELKLVICVVLAFAFLAPAQGAIILIEGFNYPGSPPASFTTVAGGGNINGVWSVGGVGVDWIGGYWGPAEGNGSVDLSGLGAGSVSTILSTVAGEYYDVSFYMSGNSAGGNAVKQLQVTVGDLNATYTFDTTGISTSNMGWILKTGSFLASGSDVITFTSLEGNAYGPALDLVTVSDVSEVPEPASALLGLAGLASLALFRRKK